jgi:hypothetical protein
MPNTQNWTFGNFIEEIVLMSEIIEIPGYKAKRDDLIKEVWKRFPAECEMLGLTDGL